MKINFGKMLETIAVGVVNRAVLRPRGFELVTHADATAPNQLPSLYIPQIPSEVPPPPYVVRSSGSIRIS